LWKAVILAQRVGRAYAGIRMRIKIKIKIKFKFKLK